MRSLTSIAQWLPPSLTTWSTVLYLWDVAWVSALLIFITMNEQIANDFTLTFQNHKGCIFIALLLEFSKQVGPQNKDLFAMQSNL